MGITRQRIDESRRGFLLLRLDQKFRHTVGHRHEMPPQLFRQPFQIRGDFLADHARHQPFKARGVELIEQRERHGHGHAIERMARLGLKLLQRERLGPADVEGLFIAGGQFRNGILLAPLIADALNRFVSGKSVGYPASAFSARRFSVP